MNVQITQSRLKELLSYNPLTGHFLWKMPQGRNSRVGTVAGSMRDGYVCIWLDGVSYKAHRLAFLHQTGQWPIDKVDHRDGVRSNNIWTNLRQATDGQNQQNRKLNANSSSGISGVTWKSRNSKWQARIRVAGKLIHLGYFDDPQIAGNAYATAKAQYHTYNPVAR